MSRTYKMESEQKEYQSLPGGVKEFQGSSTSAQPGILCKGLSGPQVRGGLSTERNPLS